jgi:hypothetical protein
VARYFAYGSNMSSARLRERVRSARALGAARLDGFAWRCNKRGADGTAKANLEREAGSSVWGVLYELDRADLAVLDRAEGGYRRIGVAVDWQGERAPAETYVSDRLCGDAPAAWYLAFLLAGAREHALPSDWVAALEALMTGRRAAAASGSGRDRTPLPRKDA